VTRKSLTQGHVAFDTSGLFWKIDVRLDPPYRGLSILSTTLIKQIWVFCKSISIYFLALALIASTYNWLEPGIYFYLFHRFSVYLFKKVVLRIDSPRYLQQIASIRKMPTYAIACRTSIRWFKRADYQLIEQLNFVLEYRIEFLKEKKRYQVRQVPDQFTKIVHTQRKLVHTQRKLVHTQCKIVHTQKYWYLI
jgi:hypothetical protein